MAIIKYVERIRRLDQLISMKSTGSPSVFAEKLGISRSTIFQTLQEMRELGLEIKYSATLESYYYENGKRIQIATEKDHSLE